MNTYLFYKSIYDRELKRRGDLDNSINIPITILTLIIGLNSIYIDDSFLHEFGIVQIIAIAIALVLSISMFFLIRSYNNFLSGFSYENIPLIKEIRNYEIKEMPNYNTKVEEEHKLSFEIYIIDELIHATDSHIKYNDKRSLDIYRAKSFIIVSLILTSIQLVIAIIK